MDPHQQSRSRTSREETLNRRRGALMCPACLASAALMAVSATMGGGVGALLLKIFRSKKSNSTPARAIAKQRRKDHDDRNNQQNATAPGSLFARMAQSPQGTSAQGEGIHASA